MTSKQEIKSNAIVNPSRGNELSQTDLYFI